jgi:transposase
MPYRLLVGVDWATASHQVCVLDTAGKKLQELAVAHRAQDVTAFVDRLIEQAGGDPGQVAVAIERPRGALVETLLERGLQVYSINPKQLDRFRDRHSVAGAKDDRLDAYVLADALRNDRHRFRKVELDDPLVLQIRELSRANEDLRQELNGLTNRLRDQIHRCAPHLLELCSGGDDPWFWDLVGRTYGPRSTTRIQRRMVQQLLRHHRIRRVSADDVLAVLRQPPMTLAPGAEEAARMHIRLLLPRLHVVHEQRKLCLKQLEDLLDQFARKQDDDDGPSDVEIIRSLPGVGTIVLGTLFAEAAVLLRERDGATFRCYAGPAPITRRSGKSWIVVMRRGCNGRLRDALYHMARVSITCDPAARAYYASLRARGHKHGRALRSVSDRWIRILMAMLRDRTLYDAGHSREPAVGAAA